MLLSGAVLDSGSSAITIVWIPVLCGFVLAWVLVTSRRRRKVCLPALVPIVFWLGFLAIYALNPSHIWSDGVGLLPVESISFLPSSVHAASSFSAWTVVATAAGFFLIAMCVSREDLIWFQWMVLAGSSIIAFWALNDRLSYRTSSIIESTGPFTYENHYAAFANLLLPVVFATGLRVHYRALERDQLSSPAGLAILVAILLGTSILVSGSRAGAVLMALSCLAMWAIMIRIQHRYKHDGIASNQGMIWLHVVMGGAFAAVLGMAVQRYGYSIPRLSRELNFRWAIIADTLHVWRDSRTWGIGPGTLRRVFPYYQSATPESVQVAHTHCEPVQWLAELGWLGLVISVVCIGFVIIVTRRRAPIGKYQWPLFRDIEGPAFVVALLTVMLHGMIDFPWRMPAIVWVAGAWAGLLCAHWERDGSDQRLGSS